MYFNTGLQEMVTSRVRAAKKQVAPAEAYQEAGQSSPAAGGLAMPQNTTYGKMEEADDGDDAPETTHPAAKPEQDNGAEEGAEEDEDDDPLDFIKRPEGIKDTIIWAISLPIYVPLYYLIPAPSERWFLVVFLESLIWIAGLTYVLVWFVEILG